MAMTPIEVEVLRNAMSSIADEAYISLMKSAYSTNIKERRDHSTAIFDAHGQVIVQGESMPLHLASMLGLVEVILEKYDPGEIAPGDLFISNDPFVGRGSHLPDVATVMPVFAGGELVLFVSNIAHHADIGGHGPRVHGGRDDGDLPGGASDPSDSTLPGRRARPRHHGPHPAERPGSRGAPGRLQRPDRGQSTRGARLREAHREVDGAGDPRGLPAHHRGGREAHPGVGRRAAGRRLALRGRARRRRHGDRGDRDPSAGRDRGRPDPVRLRGNRAAGTGQPQRHHGRAPGVLPLRDEGADRPRVPAEPRHARSDRDPRSGRNHRQRGVSRRVGRPGADRTADRGRHLRRARGARCRTR